MPKSFGQNIKAFRVKRLDVFLKRFGVFKVVSVSGITSNNKNGLQT